MSSYTTAPGDTFDTISRKKYGTTEKASVIAAANPGVLEPIQEATVLSIPDEAKATVSPTSISSSDELSLVLSSERFRFWTNITYTSQIDTFDTIDFDAPFEPSNREFRRIFKKMEFQKTESFLGDAPLFTGTTVPIKTAVSSKSNIVSVSAYSLPGVLNDCYPPEGLLPLEFKDETLDNIAKRLCNPFGIEIDFKADPGTAFRKVAISPTEKVFSQLIKLAKQKNIIISSNHLGQIVFFRAASSGNPVAKLDGSQTPVIKVVDNTDAQGFYSHITGYRGAKTGRKGGKLTVKNPLVSDGVFRPYGFDVGDIKTAELEDAVLSQLGRMIGNSIRYTVEVDTWRDPQGNLWEDGSFISLVDERCMIYNPYTFLIKTVKLNRTAKSKKATLGLVAPGAYSGVLPESLPWDE